MKMGELCTGLGRVASRFVEEMIYGIQARGSVRLTEVARALDEPISLHKTHDRLSRNLAHAKLRHVVGRQVLEMGACRVRPDTLLIVDPSDVTKKYAKKMEYLATVRDGSEKELGEGYWLCPVVAAEVGSAEITPLAIRLWSQEAPDFAGENDELLSLVRQVLSATEGRGIVVFDRGGDRRELYGEWAANPAIRFLIRQRGDRHLLYKGKAKSTLELAQACKTPYAETVIKEKDGHEKAYFIHFGFIPVRLPEHPRRKLWLVVVKGFGNTPLMLLTTEAMRRRRDTLWWAVEAYLTRWRVEDTIRFIKQSYRLEDVRAMTYQRLRNLAALVLAAAYFAAVYLGTRAKMTILALNVLKAAKRLFGIPDFRYYAIADGIREILTSGGKGVIRAPDSHSKPNPQLEIGRASCRERVQISVVAASLKKKT